MYKTSLQHSIILSISEWITLFEFKDKKYEIKPKILEYVKENESSSRQLFLKSTLKFKEGHLRCLSSGQTLRKKDQIGLF